MRLLHAASKYTSRISDLKAIYTAFIRSKLDHSSVVWHSSISKKNRKQIERIQKAAIRVILKNKFDNYDEGLKFLNIDSLDERREKHSLKFAQKCLKNEKVRNMFPVNMKTKKKTRNNEKYKVNFAKSERYKRSTIPSLQRKLNENEKTLNYQCTSELCYTTLFPITEKL